MTETTQTTDAERETAAIDILAKMVAQGHYIAAVRDKMKVRFYYPETTGSGNIRIEEITLLVARATGSQMDSKRNWIIVRGGNHNPVDHVMDILQMVLHLPNLKWNVA